MMKERKKLVFRAMACLTLMAVVGNGRNRENMHLSEGVRSAYVGRLPLFLF